MTTSRILSALGTQPQTAREIAVKIGWPDCVDSAKRIGATLYALANRGLLERERIGRKYGWYIPRKGKSYEEIPL